MQNNRKRGNNENTDNTLILIESHLRQFGIWFYHLLFSNILHRQATIFRAYIVHNFLVLLVEEYLKNHVLEKSILKNGQSGIELTPPGLIRITGDLLSSRHLSSLYPVKNFPKNNGIECVDEDTETFLFSRECLRRL